MGTIDTISDCKFRPCPREATRDVPSCQNILHGAGAISDAPLGGLMADHIGCRMYFLAQIPFCVISLALASAFLREIIITSHITPRDTPIWERLDLLSTGLLFFGLAFQLVPISLGSDTWWLIPTVIATFIASIVTFTLFYIYKRRCQAIPILPIRVLVGKTKAAFLLADITIGITAHGVGDAVLDTGFQLMLTRVRITDAFPDAIILPHCLSRHSLNFRSPFSCPFSRNTIGWPHDCSSRASRYQSGHLGPP